MTYEIHKDANDAVNKMNGSEIEGRVVTAEFSKRNRPRTSTPGIYLGPSNVKRTRTRHDYDERRYKRYKSLSNEKHNHKKR